MRDTLKNKLTFNIDFNTEEDTQYSQEIPFNIGLFFGWIKADNIGGKFSVLEEMSLNWKIKDKDNYYRPTFIDINRAAENYNVPNYVNMRDGTVADTGTFLVDGEWFPFVLFDPANPVPIPLLAPGDVVEFFLLGVGLSDPDIFQITVEFLVLENQFDTIINAKRGHR